MQQGSWARTLAFALLATLVFVTSCQALFGGNPLLEAL